MEVARPIWMLGMLVFSALGLLAITGRLALGTRLRARGPAVGFAPVALLCLGGVLLSTALAGPTVLTRRGGQTVAMVVDVSASLSSDDAGQALEFVNANIADMGPGDRVSVICFARDACTEIALGPKPPALRKFESRPVPSQTRLDRALDAARRCLEDLGPARILLVSDGNQTSGDADGAAARIRQSGLILDTVLVGAPAADDVAVERLLTPATCELGRPIPVTAWVRASRSCRPSLVLHYNGSDALRTTVPLNPGLNELRMEQRASSVGLARFELQVEWDGDPRPKNNRAWAASFVTGPPSALLVVRGSGGSAGREDPMRRLLSEMGYSVRVTDPGGIPDSAVLAGYSLIVLRDVPATELGKAGMEAIHRCVEQHGTGLVATGGPYSFSLGGYAGTELESVLPVTAEIREKLEFPGVAMLLVIDKSGSMGARAGVSKLDMAKEAAVSVMELMADQDLLGVLAFDVEPRWVVPLSPVTDRGALASRMTAMLAGGGTNLYPALLEAERALTGARARSKLVIVLSDGVSREADFKAVVTRMANAGISVSTVSIGMDSDVALMSDIARWGNGRAYYTQDMFSIPRIFASEAVLLQRPAAALGTFPCRIAARTGPLQGLSEAPPPITGYAASTARPGSEVHLVSPAGDPILASGWAGAGRCVAFTSTAFGSWDEGWTSWSGARPFWKQVMRWASRGQQVGSLRPVVEYDGETLRLALDAVDSAGSEPAAGSLALSATVSCPSGRSYACPLRHTGPGRYEAVLPLSEEGCILVSFPGLGMSAAVASPPPPEYVLRGPDAELMRRLASVGGGRPLGLSDRVFGRDRMPGRVDVTHPFLVAALVCIVAAAAARRLGPGRSGLGEAVAGAWHAGVRMVAALARSARRSRTGPWPVPGPSLPPYPAASSHSSSSSLRSSAALARLEQLQTLEDERLALERSSTADPVKLYFARVRRDFLVRELARELQGSPPGPRRQADPGLVR